MSAEQQSQILDQIEYRAKQCVDQCKPSLTLISHPVPTESPVIEQKEIMTFMRQYNHIIPFNDTLKETNFGTKNVEGGVCFLGRELYYELNPYGIAYQGETLVGKQPEEKTFDNGDYEIIQKIYAFIRIARRFYQECPYPDAIKIIALLRRVNGWTLKLQDNPRFELNPSIESGARSSTKCQSLRLLKDKDCVDVIITLSEPLLRIFNLTSNNWQETWKSKLTKWFGS